MPSTSSGIMRESGKDDANTNVNSNKNNCPVASPSNATVYLSADKFVMANQLKAKTGQSKNDSSDSSYESNTSNDSCNLSGLVLVMNQTNILIIYFQN